MSATPEQVEKPEAEGDVLVATAVRKEFGGLVAVDDVDFAIPKQGIGAGETEMVEIVP